MTSQERLALIEGLKKTLNAEAQKAGFDRLLTSLHDEAEYGVQVFSTGVPSLDIALGIGGIPRGRITEIYGPQQSGKTTVALQTAANAQRMGASILYVDAEQAIDPKYCAKLGLDLNADDFILCQPDYGEQAFDIVLQFMRKNAVDVVIIDSIAALIPKAKYDAIMNGTLEDAGKFVGAHARMCANFLGPATSVTKRSNTAVIVLNQIRKEITPMGAREGRPGGNALAHATSVVINVRRTGTEEGGKKEDESREGLYGTTRATINKNKLAPPLRQSIYDLVFGEGADYFGNLVDTCARYEIFGLKKNKGWYRMDLGDGEKSYRKNELVNSFRSGYYDGDADGIELLQKMVDGLSERVAINVFDPTRLERKVGPIKTDNVVDIIDILDASSDEEELQAELAV